MPGMISEIVGFDGTARDLAGWRMTIQPTIPAERGVAKDWIFLGARLRAARERARLSQESAAEAVSVSRSTLSSMENGKTRVDSLLLQRAAAVYGCDVRYFFGEDTDEPAPRADRTILDRVNDVAPADTIAMARFLTFCANVGELRRITNHAARPPARRQAAITTSTPAFVAPTVAQTERERLALGNAPIGEGIFDLLERQGIPTYRARLDGHLSGLLVVHEAAGPVMMVNSTQSHWRRVFTAAHLYGHYLLDDQAMPVLCQLFRDNDAIAGGAPQEHAANSFAAEFLMPEAGIRQILLETGAATHRIARADVVRLRRHFDVSFKAMLYRLLRLRVLRASDVSRMIAEPGAIGFAKDVIRPIENGQTDDVCAALRRVPASYVDAVVEAWESDLISNGRAAEMLEMGRAEFDRLYGALRAAGVAARAEEGVRSALA